MTTVISWLTAIRDAILDFLDILSILQQIADNLSPATTAHVVGRRSYGQAKRIVKGKLASSSVDQYSYEWIGLNNPDLEPWSSTGMYKLNGNAQWVVYLGYGERVDVKFSLVSDEEGATYAISLVSPDAVIGTASAIVTNTGTEEQFGYTAIGNDDYLVIDLNNQLPTDLLAFKLTIRVQYVTVNTMTEPSEDDYDKERFSFDLPLEKMEPRVGNYFFDGEGWQISGNGSEIRSELQPIFVSSGMRMKEVRITLEVDQIAGLDVYLRYIKAGSGVVGEIGFRLANGGLSWANMRPLRDLPLVENQPFVPGTPYVTGTGIQFGGGYRYELTAGCESIYEAFEEQVEGVNGFQLLFIGTAGSNQRITYGYWSVLMTSEPYAVIP